MVKRYIAGGCSNTMKISVPSRFPGIPLLESLGPGKCKERMRIESRPKATLYPCSDHFTKDCFVETSLIAAKF